MSRRQLGFTIVSRFIDAKALVNLPEQTSSAYNSLLSLLLTR